MKNALILHGTGSGPSKNWFGWLKNILLTNGYSNVWIPQLPNADHPDLIKYKRFIKDQKFDFNENTLIVGHSSGAVAALSILQDLPQNSAIDTAVMVGVYRPGGRGYSINDDIDVEHVVNKAKRMIFLHSTDDPFCPIDDARYFANSLNAELVTMTGEDHFSASINPKHTKLPKLIEILGLEKMS